MFADRGYLADGALVPRGEHGAIVDDPDEVAERVVAMVTRGSVRAVDGTAVPVVADSTSASTRTRQALLAAGVELGAFA